MSDEKYHRFLETYQRELLQYKEVNGTRPFQFRCSALPFCPVKHCFSQMINNGESENKEDFGLGWYAGFGTIAHTLLQKIGGKLGYAYGDWICTNWNCKTKIKNKVGPVNNCPKCKRAMKYEELTVKEPRTGLSGHVDGLLVLDDGYIVIDYKTSSLKKNSELEEPPLNYYTQVQSYCWMLSKYGPWDVEKEEYRSPLKIHGGVICLFARDNPFDKDHGIKMFFTKGVDKEIVIKQLKNKVLADEALKSGKFKKVVEQKLCRTKEDAMYCDFSSMGCLRSDEKVLKNLRETYKDSK